MLPYDKPPILKPAPKMIALLSLSLLIVGCPDYTRYTTKTYHTVQMGEYCSQSLRPHQNGERALALAISGGGHRAGNFGMGVLLGLEQMGALNEVDYISTVSGGGWAAGGYIATLVDHLASPNNSHANYSLSALYNKAGDDSLKRNLERGYEDDLFWSYFDPEVIFTSIDRGDALECAIDRQILHIAQGSLELGDIFQPHNRCVPQRLVPYWITNSAVVSNGAIFQYTPDTLDYYKVQEGVHRMDDFTFSDSYKAPVAIGVKSSASFPGGVPPTTLKTSHVHNEDEPLYIHLADGGLVDNLGIYTALDMLKHDPSPRKMLIVVDAFKDNDQPYTSSETTPWSGSMISRATTIGIDSARLYARKRLNALEASTGVKPVYIDFDIFDDADNAEVQRGLSRDCRDEENVTELRKRARGVGTSFNLSVCAQEFLKELGRLAILKRSSDIKRFLNE